MVLGMTGCDRSTESVFDDGRSVEQDRQYEEQALRYDKQLDLSEEQAERYQVLLSRWEEQANRFDKILDAWEKQARIQPASQ